MESSNQKKLVFTSPLLHDALDYLDTTKLYVTNSNEEPWRILYHVSGLVVESLIDFVSKWSTRVTYLMYFKGPLEPFKSSW